jgi:hypothetical protein
MCYRSAGGAGAGHQCAALIRKDSSSMGGRGRQVVETTAANTSFAEHGRTSRFVRGLGLAIAVGAGYFLIDWLALSLWIEPHKESVFSFTPGGFAAGLLIALGPGARWPVSVG